MPFDAIESMAQIDRLPAIVTDIFHPTVFE
jgi:hypothetical protein